MSSKKDRVNEALKQVIFFQKQNNIVDLGMIHDIRVVRNEIAVTIIFPDLNDPSVGIVSNSASNILRKEFGEDTPIVIKPIAEAELGKGPLAGVKNIIAVVSGKGGVGKSTVSANLAIALSKMGKEVGILDADIMGPSVPIMFGVENEQPGVLEREGKPLIIPITKYGVKVLSLGFFVTPDQALMWRGAMINKAFNQLMTDAEWGELDFLVIDMPPGTGDIQLTLAQEYRVTGTVLVTTPQKIAAADVRRAAMMYRQEKLTIPLFGLVENMAYFTPPELPEKKYYLFGKGATESLASELDIPILGRIPIVERITESGDNGRPLTLDDDPIVTRAFLDIAAETLKQVEIKEAINPN
jgi:ATP-binding protein involved in chromosome partitioning